MYILGIIDLWESSKILTFRGKQNSKDVPFIPLPPRDFKSLFIQSNANLHIVVKEL